MTTTPYAMPFGPHLTQAEVDLTKMLLAYGHTPDEVLNQILSLRIADDEAGTTGRE